MKFKKMSENTFKNIPDNDENSLNNHVSGIHKVFSDEEALNNFFNNVPVGIILIEITDKKEINRNKILNVNDYFEQISGIAKKTILQKNITDLIEKSNIPSNLIEEVFYNNQVIEIKSSLLGLEKHFHISFIKLNQQFIIATFDDYTRLKEAQDTILFERSLFQTLLNKFPEAIYFKDRKARFLRASLYLTQVFHTTPNEIIGKTDFDFFDKKLAEKKFADDMKVIETGIPIINKEEAGETISNEQRWLSTTKLPLFNRNGEIEGLFGISRDITDKKKAKERENEYISNLIILSESAINLLKITEKKKLYQTIGKTLEKHLKHSIVLYTTIHKTGNNVFETLEENKEIIKIKNLFNKQKMAHVLLVNEKVQELLFMGKIISCNRDITSYFSIKEIEEEFDELNIKHKYLVGTTEERDITGLFLILMKNGIRIIDKNFVETFIQQASLIVQRKNLEEQLIIEKERAEESDNLKSSFLANLSHEIRTPINAIQGFGELLKLEDLALNKKMEYIDIIKEKSNQVIEIISDIIDISKFEANQVKINETEENINEVLTGIVSDFQYRISNYIKKDIPIYLVKGLTDDQSTLKTDFSFVKQVIANLISNSIKFTHYGIIELGYYLDGKTITFYVQDTGIGIPEDKRDVIFDRFRQADESRTRKYGGTGLGLTISKSIINLLKGKIWVESSKYEDFEHKDIINEYRQEIEGKDYFGSRFLFSIPYKPSIREVHTAEEVPEIHDWSAINILVVEDDSFNFHYIKELLEENNPSIKHCKNGKDAVAYFLEHMDEIDVILMDLQMPVMDGYEATKVIRTYDNKIPIIVQTAYSMPEDIKQAKDAGATDYVVKPYNSVELIQKVTTYITDKK